MLAALDQRITVRYTLAGDATLDAIVDFNPVRDHIQLEAGTGDYTLSYSKTGSTIITLSDGSTLSLYHAHITANDGLILA